MSNVKLAKIKVEKLIFEQQDKKRCGNLNDFLPADLQRVSHMALEKGKDELMVADFMCW